MIDEQRLRWMIGDAERVDPSHDCCVRADELLEMARALLTMRGLRDGLFFPAQAGTEDFSRPIAMMTTPGTAAVPDALEPLATIAALLPPDQALDIRQRYAMDGLVSYQIDIVDVGCPPPILETGPEDWASSL